MLTELMAEQGVAALLLTGQTTSDNRTQIVEDVQAGGVEVLVATLQLIGEGFDCQGLATLVLATPIKFEGRLLQVVGRIMRPATGKRARVIDYVDVNIPILRRSAAARRKIFENW
jgi:superfamily II DNA or RNA helicase